MIIYSLAAGGKVSIAALILAGLVPAVILMVSNLVAAYLVAIGRGCPAGVFPGWDAVWRSLAAAVRARGDADAGNLCARVLAGSAQLVSQVTSNPRTETMNMRKEQG